MKTRFRDDADDLAHDPALIVVAGVNSEALADWIFAREILFGHRLIDDDDPRRIFRIALVECAAAKQRYFERLKIIAADHFEIAVQHIRRLWPRVLFAPKAGLPATHERSVRTDRHVLHAGDRPHFVEECFGECVDLVAVVVDTPRHPETCRKKTAWPETQRHRV